MNDDWQFKAMKRWQVAILVMLTLASIVGLIVWVPAGPPL